MAFVPRTSQNNPTPMLNNPWWYSNGNKFYAAGYGLPNCTAYNYGRVGEYLGHFDTRMPNGNGGDWYPNAVAAGLLPCGQTPALGANICYGAQPGSGYLGHVAIVEEIYSNGDLLISNSGYPSNYFWTARVTAADDYREQWAINRGYYLQGFIYTYTVPGSNITPEEAAIMAAIILGDDDAGYYW